MHHDELAEQRWLGGDRPEQLKLRASRLQAMPVITLAGCSGEMVASRCVSEYLLRQINIRIQCQEISESYGKTQSF